MRKEYTKLTSQIFNENMEPMTNVEEFTVVALIADTGKKIKTPEGLLCTRVDVGTNDSEDNYEEVDDLNFIEVIDAITNEVSGNVG